MTHTSPTTFVVWSVLSTTLNAFLLGHLWRFDRFKCLRWSNSPYNGAFKRIMTYTYLITIPLIMVYSFGFTYIKYKEGYIDIAGTIVPKPYTFWSKELRDAIFPLSMFFSFAWSFEMVTHLEELCFWFFLINAGPTQPDWFHSPYFRVWIVGSVGAIILVPTVTIVNRNQPLVCEARMFTAGSAGDLALTLGFIPILWRFPGFIRKVKAEGVDSSIIIRLRKFFELNVVRIIFRFLMQIPLLSLGLDGLQAHYHLNESALWTDLLSIVAALGCVVSSMCTLLIFFPRSHEAEYQAKEASLEHYGNAISSDQTNEANPAYSQHGHDSAGEGGYTGASRAFGKSEEEEEGSDVDADPFGDENKYCERSERRLGTGMVRERLSSKIRERERRFARSTRRVGAELHDVLSRRLRLPLSRRRHTDPLEGGSIALSFGVPSLSHSHREERERDTTKQTEPSSRSARKGSADSAAAPPAEGTALERKGTYLLTDSPVIRAKRLKEEQAAMRNPAASVSVETLQAAAAYGVGAGNLSPSTEADYGIGYGYGLGAQNAFAYGDDRKVSASPVGGGAENRDVDAFALDTTSPTSGPPTSVRVTTSPHTVSPFDSSSPTRTMHIHGPRPVKKSSSLSTNATGRRALPTPPQPPPPPPPPPAIMDDPLGAAPAYYPPEAPAPSVVPSDHKQNQNERKGGVDVEPRHPYANPNAVAYSSPTPPPAAAALHVPQGATYARETGEVPPVGSTPGVTIATGFDGGGGDRSRPSRLGFARLNSGGMGAGTQGLTAANVSRHNTAMRASQVNPLVHTFTSPIDFLDRIHESPPAGGGDGGGANGTRSQIGWAV